MEQIRIRQPKMPAAQSFIQIFETFLASSLSFIATNFSLHILTYLCIKDPKPLVILGLAPRNLDLFFKEKKFKGNEVKILDYLLFFINFQIYFLLIT